MGCDQPSSDYTCEKIRTTTFPCLYHRNEDTSTLYTTSEPKIFICFFPIPVCLAERLELTVPFYQQPPMTPPLTESHHYVPVEITPR